MGLEERNGVMNREANIALLVGNVQKLAQILIGKVNVLDLSEWFLVCLYE